MRLSFENIWKAEFFKDAAHHKAGIPFKTVIVKNLMPDESLKNVLKSTFKSTGTYTWYIGLVDNAGFSTFSYSDTAAQIGGSNGWDEFVSYSEANRQDLTLGTETASGGSGQIDNTSSIALFSINGAGNVRGAFIATSNVKSGAGGIIGGEVNFDSGTTAVVSGNILQITVIIQAFS